MKKTERRLRAAAGGHARAKVIAKRKLAVAESKTKKLRKRVRKLKGRNVGKDARIDVLRLKTASLERESKIHELRAMHVINAWRKLYEAERTKHEATGARLAGITEAHLNMKHELRMARRELRARA